MERLERQITVDLTSHCNNDECPANCYNNDTSVARQHILIRPVKK